MSTTKSAYHEAFLAEVPMAAALDLHIEEASPHRALVRMPDQEQFHNHLRGPHAGAIFTLGETASGVLIMATYGDQLERVVPLAVHAEITYLSLAKGDLVAVVEPLDPHQDREQVIAELDTGEHAQVVVHVTISREDGPAVAEMTVSWMLRLRNPAPITQA